ncbi:hypothetical protein AGMMS49938_08410 [Fibrobacterales bacterium]|nr:hypothetical protein AGMMS49938_08410 [Fibrobacterales bacterium]
MRRWFAAIFLVLFGEFAFAEQAKITLYLGGDFSAIPYHLGVLSEIERLQVPIDSVVGNDYGAFVGALWSAGWSPVQIDDLIKSWRPLERSERDEISALFKKRWVIKHKENGSPILGSTNNEIYFGKELFNLQVQEALWRADVGKRVAFREEKNGYPFPHIFTPPSPSPALTAGLIPPPVSSALRADGGNDLPPSPSPALTAGLIPPPVSSALRANGGNDLPPSPSPALTAGLMPPPVSSALRADGGNDLPPSQSSSPMHSGRPLVAPTPSRIFSTPHAIRDTNGTDAERYLWQLLKSDTSLIILQPHSKIVISEELHKAASHKTRNSSDTTVTSDSLFQAGVRVVQKNRSVLAKLSESLFELPKKQKMQYEENQIPPPRFLYLPVFDSVPSEYQGHLESFWNPQDTSILAVSNFLLNLQKNGLYPDVHISLDTGSYLQINAQANPQLALSLQNLGGTFLGANVGANADFRFVNQFGYNLKFSGFYGQGIKGAIPEIRFERLLNGGGDFFVKAEILQLTPTDYFLRPIYEEGQIIEEFHRDFTVGIDKNLGYGSIARLKGTRNLRVAIERGKQEIKSGAAYYYVYEDDTIPVSKNYEVVAAQTIFPYAEWTWESENYNRWFADEGFLAKINAGFKAVSLQLYDQSAPLYLTSSGLLAATKSLNRFFSISSSMEYGLNIRRSKSGKIILPSELYGINGYDPALENRYRFVMNLGNYGGNWATPNNTSHRYGAVSAGLSLQSNGTGLFLFGGVARDFERNMWATLDKNRIWAEPQMRVKTSIFDVSVGWNILTDTHLNEKNGRWFLTVGNF